MVSIGDFLDAFGFENLLLIATFLISFALINFSLKKVLKDSAGQPNKAVAGVVAFAVSMLIVYGVHRIGFDLENFFYDLGLDENLLEIIVPLIVLAAAIWLIYKVGIVLLLIIVGLLFIIVSFTDWVYESGILLFTGIGLLILGVIIRWWKKRKPKTGGLPPLPSSPSPVETNQRTLEEGYARQLAETQAYAAKKEAEAEKAKRIFQRQREIARKQRTRAQTAEELAVAQDAERRAAEGIKKAEAEAEKAKRREEQIQQQAQTAVQEQRKIREKTQRTATELQTQYRSYSAGINQITSKVGHIPKKGTPEYKRWKQYRRAMKAIENIAKKQGIPLK
jgi:hypothetical protein